MKLFIQIPCLNEEETLPQVIRDLPREIDGIDEIYTLIIDDGSWDGTLDTAKAIGVDYILHNSSNLGLAASFVRGIDACLFLGADIIVNTDGDNQYRGEDIALLVEPILSKRADLVVGCRDIQNHSEFSWLKKILQRVGSRTVSRFANIKLPDATSGFRALERSVAMRLSVMNTFSYTLETLIQTGRGGFRVLWQPIRVNPKTRESRLFRSAPHFMIRQVIAIMISYIFYCPIRLFGWMAIACMMVFLVAAGRNAYYLWFVENEVQKFKTGTGIIAQMAFTFMLICIICGLLGAVLSGLRVLIEDLRYRIREASLHGKVTPVHLNLTRAPSFFRWKAFCDDGAPSLDAVPEYEDVRDDR